MRIREADERRFWSKVALPNEQGCMLWLDKPTAQGYGRLRLAGRYIHAHRVSYVLAYGAIPEGLVIDHVKINGCTSRACVAPAHLEAVTNRENLHRGDTVNAQNLAKTHCVNGHAFDAQNTYVKPNGKRQCRQCARDQLAAWRLARK